MHKEEDSCRTRTPFTGFLQEEDDQRRERLGLEEMESRLVSEVNGVKTPRQKSHTEDIFSVFTQQLDLTCRGASGWILGKT